MYERTTRKASKSAALDSPSIEFWNGVKYLVSMKMYTSQWRLVRGVFGALNAWLENLFYPYHYFLREIFHLIIGREFYIKKKKKKLLKNTMVRQ